MEENWVFVHNVTFESISLFDCQKSETFLTEQEPIFMFVFGYVFKLILKACFICKAYDHGFRLTQVGICQINGEDLPTSRRADSDLFYLHGLTAMGFLGQLNLYVALQ